MNAGGVQPLSWAIRIKVAIDAARGLSFLHESEQQVIYRDFKASNILLDSVRALKRIATANELHIKRRDSVYLIFLYMSACTRTCACAHA